MMRQDNKFDEPDFIPGPVGVILGIIGYVTCFFYIAITSPIWWPILKIAELQRVAENKKAERTRPHDNSKLGRNERQARESKSHDEIIEAERQRHDAFMAEWKANYGGGPGIRKQQTLGQRIRAARRVGRNL
jgi:hypothetical protein